MANWKHMLHLKHEWAAAKDGTLSTKKLAEAVYKKLKALQIQDDPLHTQLITEFKTLSELPSPSDDEFNALWDILYGWADQETTPGQWPPHKLCWVDIH